MARRRDMLLLSKDWQEGREGRGSTMRTMSIGNQ